MRGRCHAGSNCKYAVREAALLPLLLLLLLLLVLDPSLAFLGPLAVRAAACARCIDTSAAAAVCAAAAAAALSRGAEAPAA